MEELALKMVQGQIGYSFNNPKLLEQAFVRRSYSKENGGKNNEVLEFIGDTVLGFAVVRLLVKKYGQIDEKKEFACSCDEGRLTQIKGRMVEKKNLAQRMDELGFAKYLKLGKSDIQNKVINVPSVKEDLFEAILGAVAIDCGWNYEVIQSVAEVMLDLDLAVPDNSETNYVRLIYKWEERKGVIPLFKYKEASYSSTWYTDFEGVSQNVSICNPSDYSKLNHHCLLKLLDSLPIFRGFGASKIEARMAVCKVAYEYLKEHNMLFSMRYEIDAPNKNQSINQLETLARRGYFSLPEYDFEEEHDIDGNPVWRCVCHIEEYGTCYEAESSSKKDAKKTAAFEMLKFVLDEESD